MSIQASRQYEVFICHSSIDGSSAQAVVAALEAKNIRCWIAPRDIVPGAEWGAAILEGIAASKLLLLVFSPSANASRQVIREVERAVHLGLPILPVRITNDMPQKSLEYFISTSHWLDAYASEIDKFLPYICETVSTILAGATVPSDVPKPRQIPLPRKFPRRTILGILAAAAILASIGYAFSGASSFERTFVGDWTYAEAATGKTVDWSIARNGAFKRKTQFLEEGTIQKDGQSYELHSNIEGNRYLGWKQIDETTVSSPIFPNALWAVMSSSGITPGPRPREEEISYLGDHSIWKKAEVRSGEPVAQRWKMDHTVVGQDWHFLLEFDGRGKFTLRGNFEDEGVWLAKEGTWQIMKGDSIVLSGPYAIVDNDSIGVTNVFARELWKRKE